MTTGKRAITLLLLHLDLFCSWLAYPPYYHLLENLSEFLRCKLARRDLVLCHILEELGLSDTKKLCRLTARYFPLPEVQC